MSGRLSRIRENPDQRAVRSSPWISGRHPVSPRSHRCALDPHTRAWRDPHPEGDGR
ncbi:hypothetical protein GZL_01827 [Streptomyces sp. 769]|nr:hypothetical protein GZL_01827 [Streptomyces sp. 769]